MGADDVKQFNVYLPVELIKQITHHAIESGSCLSALVADAFAPTSTSPTDHRGGHRDRSDDMTATHGTEGSS